MLHVVSDEDRSGLFTSFSREIDRSRFDLSLVCLGSPHGSFGEETSESGVPLEGLGCRGRTSYPAAIRRLAGLLRERRVDVLHAHLFEPTLVGLTAGRLAGVSVRVHTRHHSDYHTRIDRPIHVALDRVAAFMSTRVVAVSEHTREHMVAVERIPPSRIVTIPNAIDRRRVAGVTPERVREARRSLGVDGGTTMLLPARLHPEKGHPTLFRALAALRSHGLRPSVLLAGDGPFAGAYRAAVQSLGVGDQVVFLGQRPDVPTLMAAVDLVLVPSSAEAFGLVAIEAMAVGARVLVSDAGALPEVVRDGVDGRVVPRDDPHAWASALRDFMEAGASGFPVVHSREEVLSRFDFPTFVRRHERLYQELVTGDPGRRIGGSG